MRHSIIYGKLCQALEINNDQCNKDPELICSAFEKKGIRTIWSLLRMKSASELTSIINTGEKTLISESFVAQLITIASQTSLASFLNNEIVKLAQKDVQIISRVVSVMLRIVLNASNNANDDVKYRQLNTTTKVFQTCIQNVFPNPPQIMECLGFESVVTEGNYNNIISYIYIVPKEEESKLKEVIRVLEDNNAKYNNNTIIQKNFLQDKTKIDWQNKHLEVDSLLVQLRKLVKTGGVYYKIEEDIKFGDVPLVQNRKIESAVETNNELDLQMDYLRRTLEKNATEKTFRSKRMQELSFLQKNLPPTHLLIRLKIIDREETLQIKFHPSENVNRAFTRLAEFLLIDQMILGDGGIQTQIKRQPSLGELIFFFPFPYNEFVEKEDNHKTLYEVGIRSGNLRVKMKDNNAKNDIRLTWGMHEILKN